MNFSIANNLYLNQYLLYAPLYAAVEIILNSMSAPIGEISHVLFCPDSLRCDGANRRMGESANVKYATY